MNLRSLLLASLAVVAVSTTGATAAPATGKSASGEFQVAQACGWYAISVCSRNYGGASRAANRFGGYVIDTSSGAYPNFRGGWFCAVIGPKNRSAAQSTAKLLRSRGASSAYAKSAC